jgi:murein L,D-transpeptidase YafK
MQAEVAIQSFVEKWRRAWEEGDFPAYIACYHPRFETEKMDFQDWKNYKQDLFARPTKRNVQISNMQIKTIESNAVVTFRQRYLTAKHRDVGLKTLHLRHHQDNWTILKEDWRPLPYQG